MSMTIVTFHTIVPTIVHRVIRRRLGTHARALALIPHSNMRKVRMESFKRASKRDDATNKITIVQARDPQGEEQNS